MTTPTLLAIDNFYDNAEQVRKYALTLPFKKKGNYPGARTKVLGETDSLTMKGYFEATLSKKISYWPKEENTSFQYTTKDSISWVHHDETTWAAVIYLTPDAPIESGTGIFRHKESGVSWWKRNDTKTDFNHDTSGLSTDLSKWDQIMSIGNVFNRLVMYRGEYYHKSLLAGFGDDQFNGRLFQTFFFDTVDL